MYKNLKKKFWCLFWVVLNRLPELARRKMYQMIVFFVFEIHESLNLTKRQEK